ncbi:hypothetical protein QR680_002056 [Steinernema hermaphroditum]|uniref:Gamma-glutamyltransferase n=1 Tax=Steinernema hermaphroditum TaxID=289476 RepID=A0AA39LHH2_9BILA|nr:hypothetical protein QR680_002056 [Steinernema hermaphroditum]
MDDDNVLLVGDDRKESKNNAFRVLFPVAIAFSIIFLFTTFIFGALYATTLLSIGSRSQQPEWPERRTSPLGVYHKASVASDHVLCSEIGRNILLKGGNAVDAAIATVLCIGVVNPMSSGLGGGHFMTIYNSTTKTCSAVDAREIAPLSASEHMYDKDSKAAQKGWKAMGVPGELHGLRTEYEHFGGGVPWKALFEPTIELLNNGCPVAAVLGVALRIENKTVEKEPTLQDFIDKSTGKPYKAGDVMRGNRAMLRDTLKYLSASEDPIGLFYNGWMTDRFVEEMEDNDGHLTREDFKAYKSIIRKEGDVLYSDLPGNLRMCGPPPPSSSAVTQSLIRVLSQIDMQGKSTEDVSDILHKYVEASKLSYAVRGDLGDKDFVPKAMDLSKEILTDKYLEKILNRIPSKAMPANYYNATKFLYEDPSTTNIAVIDEHGNAVVVTTTVNLFFGAQVGSISTGIIWNSQMDDFSMPNRPNSYGYPPAPANFIRPGKRPMSSISPIVIFDKTNGTVKMAVGAAGGSTIISGVAQTVARTLFMGWDLKKAMDSPRLHNQLIPNNTICEPGTPQVYIDALRQKGHNVTVHFGVAEVTAILRNGSSLTANSDWRKGPESRAAGY